MEIEFILKSVVCLHAAMGHDSCGIMRIICIIYKQVWTWTEHHGERSEFRSLPMGSFLSWRKHSRISWHWTDVLNWACAFVCICACGLWEQTCKYCPVCLVQVVYIDINQCCYVVGKKITLPSFYHHLISYPKHKWILMILHQSMLELFLYSSAFTAHQSVVLAW